MMLRRSNPGSSVIDAALMAMTAEELRAFIRAILPDLDDQARGCVIDELIVRAARGSSGWTPEGSFEDDISRVQSFVERATSAGHAHPGEVDEYLRMGRNAFLSRDYAVAYEIFHMLLPAIGNGEVDLGQHELVDEVLAVDTRTCAGQYIVSMYMTANAPRRARALRSAIGNAQGVGYFWEPLREMESVAIEPLPRFDEFLVGWRALLEESSAGERRSEWDRDEDRWLREVAQRMDGTDGLATIARSTKRTDDLRAWCHALVAARDWNAALSAHDEAAEIVSDKAYSRVEFLDGAALAAQELGRKDLSTRLERAWREAPSMPRLRHWLGSSKNKATIRKRAAQALEACPKKAHGQKAFLHILLREPESAAKLLAAAPGLGWSDSEHPGHLLFAVFHSMLSGSALPEAMAVEMRSVRRMDIHELERMCAEPGKPHLRTPEVDELCTLAGVDRPASPGVRIALLTAMRKAAKKRIAGVTENKRRRHYGHAAQLVAACAALDPSPRTSKWVAGIRAEYRRFRALQRQFDEHLTRVRGSDEVID